MTQRIGGITHTFLSLSVLALLSACGGGGSGTQTTAPVDGPNPPTGNPNPPSDPGAGDPSEPNPPTNPGGGDPGTPNPDPGSGDPNTPDPPSTIGETATATAQANALTTTRTTVYNLDSPGLSAGGWQPTALLETSNEFATSPRVVFDSSGDGFAVWAQGNDLMARRYEAASAAWGNTVALDGSNEAVFQPRIAVDRASGNAIAVWTQSDGVAASLYASRFNTLTNTWSAAESLEAATGDVDSSDENSAVAVNGSHAAVAWLQNDGTTLSIYLSRLVGGDWTDPVLVESSDAVGQFPKVAIDPNGNVTIAWRQFDVNTGTRINTRRWDNTAGAFDAIKPMNTNGDRQPVLQFDAAGSGFLLWRAGPITRRFDVTTGQWSVEVDHRNPGATPDGGDISVDEDGNAMVVWVETDVSATYLYSRRYDAAAGAWLDRELLVTTTGLVQPTVSMSGDDAVVSWLHQNASNIDDVYSIKQTDGVWGTARLLEARSNPGSGVTSTINGAGNAAVVWVQADDSNISIYEARYLSPNIVVAAGDTWQSLANELYQANSVQAGAALQAAMGGVTLTEGLVLTGFPATLTVTEPVPAFYTVLATDTWAHVADTVYGVSDAAAIAALRAALGNPTLSAGLQLVVPSSFQYTTSANFSAPLDWSRVNTTATEYHQLDNNLLTVPLNDWSAPQALESSNDPASGPRVMFDAQGNGMAVWSQGSDVIARRYTAAAGWSMPTVLDTNPNGASLSRVFVDRTTGNAVASWVQSDDDAPSVYVSTYDVDSDTWSAAVLLETSDDEVSTVWGPAVGMSGEHAAVTWIQSNNGADHTYLSRWEDGSWTPAARIDTGAEQCMQAELGVDANGNVTVSWRQLETGFGFHIYTKRWDNTAMSYGPIMSMNGLGDRQAKIGLDAQGNAVLMWRGNGVQARTYDVTTGQWSTQYAISTDPNAGTAELSVSASGDALAAWSETLGGVSTVYASYYDASAGTWSAGTAIADNLLIYRVSVSLVGDSGVVAFVSDDGSVSGEDVYAVRLQNGVWGAATLLETLLTPASEISAHIDPSNTATALWVQNDGAAPTIFMARSNSTPYYPVPSGATWQSLANTLYNAGSAAAADALEAAMASTTLTTGLHLEGLPATLVVTPTVPTYYVVQSGDTWQSIALSLYGTSASEAATALWIYLGQPTLTVGQTLAIPSQLDYSVEE